MNNLKYKLMQFMYGRNGVDSLGYAIMALYFVVFMVNSFINIIYLTVLGFMLVAYMFYRMFSKDLLRRRRENAWFMKKFNKVKAFFKQTARSLKEIKTHRYRKCPGCKVTLRLPRKIGKHTVVCPKCKHRFEVRVWM
jgi:hypothetical protein